MTKRTRTIIALIAGSLLLAMTLGASYATREVFQAGTIAVEVVERGGSHIAVCIPAALVRVAIWFVPDRILAEAGRELRPWWPVVDRAFAELASSPDGLFIDVKGPDGIVRIGKENGQFFVRVNSRRETVNISIPLDTVNDFLKKLRGAFPDLGEPASIEKIIQAGLQPGSVLPPPTPVTAI